MKRLMLTLLVIGMMAAASAQAQPGFFPAGGSGTGSWLAHGTYSIGYPDTTKVKILNDGQVLTAGRVVSLEDSITLTVAPNETIDLSTGNNFRLTLTASDTLGFTGGIDGQVIQVTVTNGGTHTLTWSGVAWPGGTAPTLTAVANKRSIFSFLVSGSMVHGVSVLNY